MTSAVRTEAGRYPRFGVEEEFFLLDPMSGRPHPVAAAIVGALPEGVRERATREFLAGQIETATGICSSAGEALDQLVEFRVGLARAAASAGVVAAGTGTAFDAEPSPSLTPGERYADLAERHASLVDDHQVAGLHVHVGVPDPDAGIRALGALASWLPFLTAISANSPWWRGLDTGFESWRGVLLRRWTTHGCPPAVATAAEYDERVRALVGLGGTRDAATIAWDVRMSPRYPTVELRVADSQLTADDALAVSLIARGLASRAMRDPKAVPAHDPVFIDAACWHAARFGLSEGAVAPGADGLIPFDDASRILLDALDAPDDDLAIVERYLQCVAEQGTGAARQRAAAKDGWPALRELFVDTLAGVHCAA